MVRPGLALSFLLAALLPPALAAPRSRVASTMQQGRGALATSGVRPLAVGAETKAEMARYSLQTYGNGDPANALQALSPPRADSAIPAHGSGRYPYSCNLDAFDLPGVPGQGNNNPPGAFNGHWITLCNGCYYDGSYGTSKISGSEKDKLYEDTSLDGYGEEIGSPYVRENDVSSGSHSELDYQIDD